MLLVAVALASLAALAAGGSRPARASGFAAARFGGEHGHVTTTNPTALYFNPAGIALSSGTALYADGTLAMRRATWTHQPAAGTTAEPPGTEGANVGQANLSNIFGGPMLGASTRLGDFALGLALSVPFGGRARWSRNPRFESSTEFPLAADGVQRWHGIEGALTFIYGTLGLAYRFGPVAVGVTGNLIRSSMYSTQAKTPIGDGQPDTTREGRATLDVRGTHASFGVGALIELLPGRLWLGGSYQAQPALGPMQLRGTITQEYQGQRTPFPVTLTQALPDIVRIGARWRPGPAVELRLAGELTRWSLMQTQCAALEGSDCRVDGTGADVSMNLGVLQNLRRRWSDTFGVRAGASFWARPALELFAGVAIENGAAPDQTLDPALADADNGTATLGMRFQLTRGLLVATSYSHIQYRTRDTRGRSELPAASAPTRRADGGGRYTQWIGLFNLNLEQRF